MKKIGVCGHFNFGNNPIGGQTIKTRVITKSLEEIYGESCILKIDTDNWKKKKLKLFYDCIILAINSKNIIVLPAPNGVKVLIPLFVILGKILNRKIHYIVVGAWLPNVISNSKLLLFFTRKVSYIYCQTQTLKDNLNQLGVKNNTYIMPNFKDIKPLKIDNLVLNHKYPIKLCMVSRINYEKGVESAIRIVSRINKERKEKIIQLDIFGPIEEEYKTKFISLLEKSKESVEYIGVVNQDEIINKIKNYYLLLFPTKYFTEGFPGTILDAYLSGVPVLASRWESSKDIIIEGYTGFTYTFDDEEDFYNKLENLIENNKLVMSLKSNCLKEASQYSVRNSIDVLVKNVN